MANKRIRARRLASIRAHGSTIFLVLHSEIEEYVKAENIGFVVARLWRRVAVRTGAAFVTAESPEA